MFDKMMDQFKDYAELKIYAESLQRTITIQAKKIQELELKASSVPLSSPISFDSSIADEEIIAREQLQRLRDVSVERTLTLEETKKLETFHKILKSVSTKEEIDVTDLSAKTPEELMAELEAGQSERV